MFDTNLVVVGNVLTAPEWRRVQNGGSLVANFRVASTARRFDRSADRWVDGNNMRVRVVAWRRLAEGVASSIAVGDPVIIYGRVYTRDWKDENGTNRTSYEMEAFSIGHDLARGRARFTRTKAAQATTVVEDAESEAMIGGELTVELGPDEPVIAYGDGLPDGDEPTFQDVAPGEPGVLSDRRRAERADEAPAEPASEPAAEDVQADEDLALEVERLVAAQPPGARRTRRTKREPLAA